MEAKSVKAVVLGKVPEDIFKEFIMHYPNYRQYIFFAGQVIQSDTAPFIVHSKFSIIFYSTDIPNNRYCEPNRMFQCLAFGKPVIVGCNEPMKNVVSQFGNGIVLDNDGRSMDENVKAIREMVDVYPHYVQQARNVHSSFAWESQSNVFEDIFKMLGV